MNKQLYCAECHREVYEDYYKCEDNFLQTQYFDSEEENCFCSIECFCDYLSLENIDGDDYE